MRKTRLVFLIGILVSFGLSSLSAQTLGDYQTNANSSWATVATWQVHNGTSFVALNNAAAGAYQNVIPSNAASPASGKINIRNNVPITASISVDELTVSAGTLTVNAGQTLTVTDAAGDDLTFTGGAITVAATGSLIMSTTAVPPVDGTVFRYARNGGTMPKATWETGSELIFTGITATSPTLPAVPDAYQFVTWNCAGQTAIITLAGRLTTVNKDLLIINTNGQQLRFATTQVYTLVVGGDFTVQNNSLIAFCTTAVGEVINLTGSFDYASSGTSSLKSSGTYTFNVGIDFSQSSGQITASTAAGVGTITVKGDFAQSGGTITVTGAGSALFNLIGVGPSAQSITALGTISQTINFSTNNPFGLLLTADLTLPGALTQAAGAGNIDLNGNALAVSGNFTQASGAIAGNSTASFTLQGAGTLPGPAVTFAGTGELLKLEINQTGTLITSSPLIINNLNLLNGTISSNSITMTVGGVIRRTAGAISATPAGTGFDVLDVNAGAISTGPELPASATQRRPARAPWRRGSRPPTSPPSGTW